MARWRGLSRVHGALDFVSGLAASRGLASGCGWVLLLLATLAHGQEIVPSSETGLGSQAESEEIPVELKLLAMENFKRCDTAPALVLNEVCAVGTECDEDVRIGDFIEVYNPSSGPADLACFALINREGGLFLPRGDLRAREVKGWGEKALGFRIRKKDDEVLLLRLKTTAEGDRGLQRIDSLTIRDNQAHSVRLPDGGSWRHAGVEDAEAELRGSFGEPNVESEVGGAP